MTNRAELFWAKVRKTDDCWLWTGAIGSTGGGIFTVRNRAGKKSTMSAHHFSYELAHGALPARTKVFHTCDTLDCVRPEHLIVFASDEERFWHYVDKTGECWIWTGNLGTHGYGQIIIVSESRKGPVATHRFSYELAYGPIPAKMEVCHRCDTPACVRPDHLFLGTHKENMDDMLAKGRGKNPLPQIGERHHAAKLSEVDVRLIRTRYAAGEANQYALAKEFGVSRSVIGGIVRRHAWRHVD